MSHLIAFEGLDQSGKQTQAARLLAALEQSGHETRFLSFPAYETLIGADIGRALRGERDHPPDVMQLLYIANRYEFRLAILEWLAAGAVVVCDRYLASSVAYGAAQGLDEAWLVDVQSRLPQPSLNLLLDIPPEVSLRRKQRDRDRFEQDVSLLERVRRSYLGQAAGPRWVLIDGDRDKDSITQDVVDAVRSRLGLLSGPGSRLRPPL